MITIPPIFPNLPNLPSLPFLALSALPALPPFLALPALPALSCPQFSILANASKRAQRLLAVSAEREHFRQNNVLSILNSITDAPATPWHPL